jgi:ketosteroid isomerase-like protein
MTMRDELDAINAGMARALAAQDAKQFASYYADDARLLSHGQPIIWGRGPGRCTWAAYARLLLLPRCALEHCCEGLRRFA